MKHPPSLKGLAAICVLKYGKIIPPHEIPPSLKEDLRNLNFFVKLKKEEAELEKKMGNVQDRIANALYEHLLYRNLWIDSPSDDPLWNTYLLESMMKHSRIGAKSRREKAEILKEKELRDDEEEMILQQMNDFGTISVLVDMIM